MAPIIQVAHPGQYLQEVEIGPRLVSGAGRSLGAIPVVAEKGAIGIGIVCNNFDDYSRIFGNPVAGYHASDCINGYFSESRAPLVVTRIAHYSSGVLQALRSSVDFYDASVTKIGTMKGHSEGAWSNGAKVKFEHEDSDPKATSKSSDTPSSGDQSFNLVNADSFEVGDFVKISGTVTGSEEDLDQTDYALVTEVNVLTDQITLDFGSGGLSYAPAYPVTVTTLTSKITVTHRGSTEVFERVSISETSSRYLFSLFEDDNYGINSKSTIIIATEGTLDYTKDSRPSETTVTLVGGDDGLSSLAVADFKTGVDVLADIDSAKIFFSVDHWGITGAGASENSELYKYAVAKVKAKRFAMAIGDVSEEATKTGLISGSAYYEVQTTINYKDMFGALYYPWIQVTSLRTNRPTFIPCAGDVAGMWTQNDETRGMHTTPAGESTRFSRILALKHDITDADQDILNPIGLNCLRSFPGVGTIIWGGRTQSNNPKWRYIGTRRYQSWIEESIITSTRWAAFEPHTPDPNDPLRTNLSSAINSFLTRLALAGTLASKNPSQAFAVRVDEGNNTQDTIDEGRVIMDIGVAHSKPGEFLIYRFTQTRAGSQIEQISQI